MTGLPPSRADLVVQRLARLDVGDDRRARVALQHLGREDLHQLVAAHDPALAVDHADPIAIAVERDADLGARGGDRGDQMLEVLGHGRIGVVIGEPAVDLDEQQFMSAGQPPGQRRQRISPAAPLPASHTTDSSRPLAE